MSLSACGGKENKQDKSSEINPPHKSIESASEIEDTINEEKHETIEQELPGGTDGTESNLDTSVLSSTDIRPEFKEAMDSYEEFFDEYAAFMKKYAESGGSLSMLSDYMEFLDKYTETMEAMEAWEEGEMSTEEAAYYLEVTTRINQKLLNSLS